MEEPAVTKNQRRHKPGVQRNAWWSFFFPDIKSTVRTEFVPAGATEYSTFYCNVLKLDRLWRRRNWLLHHDSAPAQKSLRMTHIFFFKWKTTWYSMTYRPSPPSPTPSDLALIPRTEFRPWWRRFDTLNDTQKVQQAGLNSLEEKGPLLCFWAVEEAQGRCVRPQWDYFEGGGDLM